MHTPHTDRLMETSSAPAQRPDVQLLQTGLCAIVEQLERLSGQIDTLVGSLEVGDATLGETIENQILNKDVDMQNLAARIAFEISTAR